jgi:mannose-6-phosphate isomerase-like protein (cupin superfamily)
MDVAGLDQLSADTRASGTRFHEFLRVDAMSCGMYILPGGGTDDQTPHVEDEIYVVHRGSGQIRIGEADHAIKPGDVIFVGADVEHRFFDFSDDLELLVVFAPAYTGRRAAASG